MAGASEDALQLLRGAIFRCSALALAGPRWLTTTTDPAVVLLRDVSASIGGRNADRQRSDLAETFAASNPDRVAEVAFAREPLVVRGFGPNATPETSARTADEATDLSVGTGIRSDPAAGRPARPNRPFQRRGLHDRPQSHRNRGATGEGRDRHRSSARRVRARCCGGFDQVAGSIREGEIFDLSAEIFSTTAVESATIRLYQNDLLVSEMQRELPKGRLGSDLSEPARRRPDGTLRSGGERRRTILTAENNRKRVAVAHSGRPKVLVDR